MQLDVEVERFVDEISAVLAELSGRPAVEHRRDVLIEASNVVAALVDTDGRHAEAELHSFLDVLGPRLDPPLITSAAQLRDTGLLDGRRSWLDAPSVLADLLLRADARDGTTRSHRYLELVGRLEHLTAALDLVPSPAEIDAIDAHRTMLLRAMDTAGVRRPGTPSPPTGSPTTPPRPIAPGTGPGTGTSGPATSGPASPGTATPGTAGTAQPADTAPRPDLPPVRPIADVLAELDALVGLDHVKAEVRRLTSLLHVQQLRAERGLPTVEASRHLVFTGNPGTGKTTVARLLAQIYRSLGLATLGHLVETDRSKLVAGFVGQTATRTAEVLTSALGGTLLIDEAYALARGGENDFGLEAIDTIVKFMEDHRDDLSIVAAGYTAEMADLIDANPGLKSRFTRTIHFPDYTTDELVRIFLLLADRHHYHLTDDALARVRHLVEIEPRDRGFGNARFVRNLFEAAVAHQALRVAAIAEPTEEHLVTVVAEDVVPVDA